MHKIIVVKSMLNEINFYYRIYPEKIYNENQDCYFYIGNIKYYLVLFTRKEKDFHIILTISESFKKRNVLIDEIILNKDGSYFSQINGNNYILLKINENNLSKSLVEINSFDKLLKTSKKEEIDYVSWNVLWAMKIDYYEKNAMKIIEKNRKVKESFDYFVGMAENAIVYVKETLEEEKEEPLVISHKRFNNDFTGILNPFNFVIDYEARDISLYIQKKFFDSIFPFNEIEELLNTNTFSSFTLKMIFARLIYPTYYFDVLDKIIKGKNCNKEIENIIFKIDSYEKFLIEIYEFFSEYHKIPRIDWLYRNN